MDSLDPGVSLLSEDSNVGLGVSVEKHGKTIAFWMEIHGNWWGKHINMMGIIGNWSLEIDGNDGEVFFFSRQFMEVHGKRKLIGIDGIMGVTSVWIRRWWFGAMVLAMVFWGRFGAMVLAMVFHTPSSLLGTKELAIKNWTLEYWELMGRSTLWLWLTVRHGKSTHF